MSLGVCSLCGCNSAQGHGSDWELADLEEKLVELPGCDGGQNFFFFLI